MDGVIFVLGHGMNKLFSDCQPVGMEIPEWGPLVEAVFLAFGHCQYVQALSVIFILALVIGAILDDGGRVLLNWLIAIAFAAIGLEFTRFIYWSLHGGKDSAYQSLAITLIGLLIYTSGLTMGWVIAQVAKQQAHKKLLSERFKQIEKEREKTDGDFIEKS